MLLASSNVFYWAKVLSRFVSVQIIVQILGMVSGILIVRTLSREEYALFTIANSFQSTLNVLADSGIISALSAIGGRVFKDKSQFSELIQTSLRLRYRLAAMVVLPTIPILLWMLTSNGASLSYAILVICATLIELNFHLKTAILLMPLQLHAQINRIQTLDFLVAFSRLSSLVAARFILLNTFTSILSSAISIGLRLLYLNRWTFENIDKEASINKEYEKEITLIIRSQFSYFLFYCFQGQIGIWLISIFGQPGNVAEVGALGRLGVIFSIVNSVMANIISPSYARCQSIQTLRNRYW